MKPAGAWAFAFALSLAALSTLFPLAAALQEEVGAEAKKNSKTGLVSIAKEFVRDVANTENQLGALIGVKAEVSSQAAEESKGSRRRRGVRRRKKKTTSSRRRRRAARRRSGSKTASRRRRRISKTPTAAPAPAPTKADARPRKIEAGWGDMAKQGEFFTLFISGSGFDPAKDRALVIHGDDSCGSGSARIATTTGSGDVPSGLSAWKSLKCNGLTSGSSKLACGDGESNGVKFADDKWVDTYKFKVCVCDFSKKNRCSSKSDFDTTPSSPTLTVNPTI